MTLQPTALQLEIEQRKQANLLSIREQFEAVGVHDLTDAEIVRMAWLSYYYVAQWDDNTPEGWVKAVRLVLDICGVAA